MSLTPPSAGVHLVLSQAAGIPDRLWSMENPAISVEGAHVKSIRREPHKKRSLAQVPMIILRPAVSSDAAYLLRLEETCMRTYAEALWGSWRQDDTADTFDTAGHHLIGCDGYTVGCVAEVWHSDHLFIEKLYVDVPFQNRGIGAAVLGMKTGEAATRGLPTALSVLTTNPALAFYRREGFEVLWETSERRLLVKAATRSKGGTEAEN